MTRLAPLRPLTPQDERLRVVLNEGGLDARLLYAQYGPKVLTDCAFAKPGDSDASRTYLFYALPSLTGPHFAHLVVLGLVTSRLLGGRAGASWRTLATIAALALAAADVYFIAAYDPKANLRSTRATDIDFAFWKARVWRGIGIAALDAGLGWFIWLQATGRAFVAPLTAGERVTEHATAMEALLVKNRGLGVVRNGTVRDAATRGVVERYWVKEGEVMQNICEEPEVLAAQRSALRRLDTGAISRDAQAFVDSVMPSGARAAGAS